MCCSRALGYCSKAVACGSASLGSKSCSPAAASSRLHLLLPESRASAPSSNAVGAPISCTVILSNDGNFGLSAFALVVGTTGYTLQCTDSSVLDAGSTRNCTLNRSIDQVSDVVSAEQTSSAPCVAQPSKLSFLALGFCQPVHACRMILTLATSPCQQELSLPLRPAVAPQRT